MSIKGMLNQFVGFDDSIEALPEVFDQFNSKQKLRQLFLSMITPTIQDYTSFTKYEQCKLSNYPLNEIFKYKIKTQLPCSFIRTYTAPKSFKLDIASSLVINNYLNNENKIQVFHYKKLLPLARIISLCFVNNKMQLLFDINLLFHQFVFNKIKRLHKDKEIIDSGDSICILGKVQDRVKIYTTWKNINGDMKNIDQELSVAIDTIKESEFKSVYLVYPKADNFNRHTKIKVEELEDSLYNIKVIPYSLRSTLRNKGLNK